MSIAVFASGSGSNFERLVEVSRHAHWQKPISLLIVDRPEAQAIDRAKRLQIPVRVFRPKTFQDKAAYERAVLAELKAFCIQWIVLAGYMRLISPTLLEPFQGRIINIHPSLLPAFPGKDAVGQALAYGVKVTGVTVHYVDEGIDTGAVIAQRAVPISDTDDHESLTTKIQAVEHVLYPDVVRELAQRDFGN